MKKTTLASRILTLMLALVMVAGLAACGGGTTTTETPATEAPATEAPATEAPATEAPEAEPEEKTDTLKIGALLHQTDWFAGVDMANVYEFQAMIDYVNNDMGGWKIGDTTYTLEGVMQDGRSDPDAVRAAAIALVDAGVDFSVVTNDFWVINAQDIFEEAGVLYSCAYPVYVPGYFGEANPMSFTASNGSAGEYATGFAILSEIYPDVKSVIFANDDNGNNEALFALLKEAAAEYGIEVLDNYVMYAGDTTDYSATALQIVNSGADCFMGNGSPDAYGAILKEVRALGSDAVMACIQGKPVSTIMEYAPAEACYNGFTVGGASDPAQNPEMYNAVKERTREMFGDEAAENFDGAAANNLYVMLQMMQIAGSTDPAVVAKTWESQTTIDTLYGLGTIGGLQTYGIANHAVGHPKPVSIMNLETDDGTEFWGWIDVTIP